VTVISGGVGTASFVDELGIEIGIVDEFRLKASYQPVFARHGDTLSAVAACGSTTPFRNGQPIPVAAFHNAVLPRHDLALTALTAALSLRNLGHAGVDGLKLMLRADLRSAGTVGRVRAAVHLLAAEIARDDLSPNDICVELAGLAEVGPDAVSAAFAALQQQGIRIAVLEQGNGPASGVLPDLAPADLVRIDGGWFRTVARQPQTARLFAALVRAYRSRGADILVDGIATETMLRVALDSGADLLCGPLLAPTALAGALFPDTPVTIQSLLTERRVITLFP
jgi:EAL domain-containing protein (putative c-di-GMP-specific phosphodiesterase class I)